MTRFVQELLGHRQIARRFSDAYVAQIGRQVRQKKLNILSLSIPGHKPPDRERVAEVMKTWMIVESVHAIYYGCIANAFERQLFRQMRYRATLVSHQKVKAH